MFEACWRQQGERNFAQKGESPQEAPPAEIYGAGSETIHGLPKHDSRGGAGLQGYVLLGGSRKVGLAQTFEGTGSRFKCVLVLGWSNETGGRS